MKSKKIILALTLTITMTLGVTVYAATESISKSTTTSTSTSSHQKAGIKKITGMNGYDYLQSVLKNKLSMTEQEITDGLNSGKTMFDLAKAKGFTEEQFKSILLEEKTNAIDAAVTEGKITKEEGDSVKEIITTNMESCTGIPGQKSNGNKSGKENCNGQGKKNMSSHGNCEFKNSCTNSTVE